MRTIPLIVSKKSKYLAIDKESERFVCKLQNMEERNLKRLKHVEMSKTEWLNFGKILVLPEVICKFSAVPVTVQRGFCKIKYTFYSSHEFQGTKCIAKGKPKWHSVGFKNYDKDLVIKTLWSWNKHIDQLNRIESSQWALTYNFKWFLRKVSGSLNEKMPVFIINDVEKLDIHMQKIKLNPYLVQHTKLIPSGSKS